MGLGSRKRVLEKKGYRIVGNHSSIKVCNYCRTAIRGTDKCYKNKFYGIDSRRCVQASVTLDICNLRCEWCWRDINYKGVGKKFDDEPKKIINGLVEEQKKILVGFYGNKKIHRNNVDMAMKPKHVALSLSGDACLYKKLPELVGLIHKEGMTSFLVTNGTFPNMVKRLVKHQPTQLYITLPAPDEKTFLEVCRPFDRNAWKKIMKSLKLLKHFNRGTVRLTLYKNINMIKPDKYARILESVGFRFLEVKAAMPVGYAQYRLKYSDMPLHNEIKGFAKKIARLNKLRIIDEKRNSRVVLLMKRDSKDRKLKF